MAKVLLLGEYIITLYSTGCKHIIVVSIGSNNVNCMTRLVMLSQHGSPHEWRRYMWNKTAFSVILNVSEHFKLSLSITLFNCHKMRASLKVMFIFFSCI